MHAVTNIQKYSIHDGDGIRTTVFFKGCHLKCQWCHNPETQKFETELQVDTAKCTGCGRCAAVCPQGAITISAEGKAVTDRSKCIVCGKEYEFLTFTESAPKYSFAASMGVDSLPENVKEFYKKNLLKFRYLSVREEQAAAIIKDLVNREVDVTLDPTLLLKKSEWDKIIKKPSIKIDKRYICAYFLGEVPNAVYLFSENKGLPIYYLNDINYRELFIIEPREFLYILKNAEFVLTDSFHGIAFSIKFHKEFYAFKRQGDKATNLFSRIESITKRFGLESRVQERVQIEDQTPINHWDQIDKELIAEAETSIRKLINAMEYQAEIEITDKTGCWIVISTLIIVMWEVEFYIRNVTM